MIEKRKTRPAIYQTPHGFYAFVWGLHAIYVIRNVTEPGDELLVVTATVGTQKKQNAFTEAVENVMERSAPHIDARTAFWRAGTDPRIQIADYCCWAIQRKWERDDDRSYLLIANKISSEFDVFRRESETFYLGEPQ